MKKIIVLLLVLFLLAVIIGTSPLIDWLHANAEEADTSSLSTEESTQDITSTAAPETDEGLAYSPETQQKAIVFAMILAGGTVLVSLAVFIKKRTPYQ